MCNIEYQIVNHNPEWIYEYKKIEFALKYYLKDFNTTFMHVGSTSISSLSAVPILDIDILLRNSNDYQKVCKILSELGYENKIDSVSSTKNLFETKKYEIKFFSLPQTYMPHKIYLLNEYSETFWNHYCFKKYLSKNNKSKIKYELLKNKIMNYKLYTPVYEMNMKKRFILPILNRIKNNYINSVLYNYDIKNLKEEEINYQINTSIINKMEISKISVG